MKRLLLAACIVSLTACGGGKDDVKSGYEDKIRASGQSLVYSFPLADQVEVPTPSPVVLRFTSAVTDPATANVRLLDANGQPVAASMTSVDGDRGLILTPDTPLNPLTHYTIDIPELALADGKSAARSLHFTTRGLHQGPAASVGADTFDVLRRFPDGQTLPVADLSSLRLQLSQPLDRNTVKYGDAADSTISLVDANGQLVPARVLVGDSYLTIDPVNDMVGGAQYTLKIATGSAGLKSSRGLTLPATGMGANAWSWSFTPEDTRPPASTKNPNRDRARMVQIISDTNMDSPLTGKRVNLVPMYSVLLGTENSGHPATPQASGYLAAELAHIPEHDETTPLRIDRGSLIKASSLPIYIGGEVPAGFSSGEVYMEFLSDATGYLIENPYSTNPEAPKLVRLMMDMGISAEGDIANGSVTQTLMHIELVGTALVEDGLMTLNAVGVVQPNILGTERAAAVLSFYMQGLDDQVNAPVPPVDERPLEVVSWTMEDQSATGGPNKALWANPSDPIIINFNRALDPESIVGKVKLLKTDNSGTDVEQDIEYFADGAALVVRPKRQLIPSSGAEEVSYLIKVGPEVAGLNGEGLAQAFEESFGLAAKVTEMSVYRKGFTTANPWMLQDSNMAVARKSPFILALYPGFPCALDSSSRDLSIRVAGRCRGGMQPHLAPGTLPALEPDDLIPVVKVPKNRPIVVVFSKEIDPLSVSLGQTFSVFSVDDMDNVKSEISGNLILSGDVLKFYPDTPWEEGGLYRYELRSNGDISDASGACDPHTMICSTDGLPLQTQMLSEFSVRDAPAGQTSVYKYWPYFIWEEKSPSLIGGGPTLVQYFEGGEASAAVLQLLRLADGLDKNANLVNDSTPSLMGPIPAQANGITILAGISFNTAQFFEYQLSENEKVSWDTDLSTQGLEDINGVPLDPNGVKPPPNSAKILSIDMSAKSIAQAADKGFDTSARMSSSAAAWGLNVGCGYESYSPLDDQAGCDTLMPQEFSGGSFKGVCYYGVPAVCPKDKFTYISGALFAEVLDGGSESVNINIYPGHMVTSSFRTYINMPLRDARGLNVIDTGYQLMRMRYNQGGLVEAKIKDGSDGPRLETETVRLYLDAPYLVTDITRDKTLVNNVYHNLYSYPVSMELAGPVSFLDDGRMVAQQFNKDELVIEQKVNAPMLRADLLIPAGGVHVKYVSEAIK